MTVRYCTNSEIETLFSKAREQFDFLLENLTDSEMSQKQHGDVEEWLMDEGTELLRILLQGHFDLRAETESPEVSVKGNDGVDRTHARYYVRRKLTTMFGTIEQHRIGYTKPDSTVLYPMDMALNLGDNRYSDGLCKRVATEASKISFDETVKAIKSTTSGHIPKRQCSEIVANTAQDFEYFYSSRSVEEEKSSDLLVITTDSKGIVMRSEDLRPATKKAAEMQTGKTQARLSPGEKKNRKRMATAAAVYTVAASPRTADQVMSRSTEDKLVRPTIENKRVWASVERGSQQVIQEAVEEALRRDPGNKRDWVVVVDGEIHQMSCIHKELKTQGANATVILDYIHVLEYVWKAAYCFYSVGSNEAEVWVQERAHKILQGKSVDVGAGIRRYATRKNLSQKERKNADKCADYLQNNKAYLKYDIYLKAGYPIASGVIEGACRHLINDRLGITGARWRLRSAESVLKLRALRSSGDFEAYWHFHKEQELLRNHTNHYEKPELFMVA